MTAWCSSADVEKLLAPGDIGAVRDFIAANRSDAAPFDIVSAVRLLAISRLREKKVAPYAEAGATWWLEGRLPWKESFDDFRRRVLAGPPAPFRMTLLTLGLAVQVLSS